MPKAVESDTVDRSPRFEERKEVLEGAFIPLGNAMCLLMYGIVVEQTNPDCLNPSDTSLAHPRGLLFGLEPDQHASEIFELEVRLTRAARNSALHFRGVKTFELGASSEPTIGKPKDWDIPAGYFGSVRGFDFEEGRIKLASCFGDPLEFHSVYDTALIAPRRAYWEWINVSVERDGFLAFARSEGQANKRRRSHAELAQIRKLLEGFRRETGSRPTHRKAKELVRTAGLSAKDAVVRRIVTSDYSPRRGRRPKAL